MGRLTIDEVIKHCDETIEQTERVFRIMHDGGDFGQIESKSYWEHKQVAEWLAELKRYKDLEEAGRLVVLPCKVGDYVYDTVDGTAYKTKVVQFTILEDRIACRTVSSYPNVDSFGKRVFLTKEEAEAALKGGE